MIRWPIVTRIAAEEWRYWLRSRLGLSAAGVALLLIVTSLFTTAARIDTERTTRESLQTQAEETFRDQPARHPHRMVHYGHYVFRTPAPLALIDPGVDPYTGTVMFLEGHKQNTATFSPLYTNAGAGPLAQLTPALIYQLLVPLLLIMVGFAAVSREREAKTDRLMLAASVDPVELWLGKCLALAGFAAVALVPLMLAAAITWANGEQALIVLAFILGYAAYLLVWVLLICAASAWSSRSSAALLLLLSAWLALGILAPRIGSSAADLWSPLSGKVQMDLDIAEALRDKGDGHNANDPAFAKLRAQLLAQYDVATVDELPVNFRGIVAQTSEATLTAVLNEFAERRMAQELAQTRIANGFSLISPTIAIKAFSINAASTGVRQHHRFLREAEATRFDFVQGLNRVHAEELDYAIDVNRNTSDAASNRARVSADNWRLLKAFPWRPESSQDRFLASSPFLVIMLLWIAAAAWLGITGMKRAAWNVNV